MSHVWVNVSVGREGWSVDHRQMLTVDIVYTVYE